jgi:hypothetical protein
MADAVDAFRRISWLIFKWLLISVSVVIGPAVAIGGGFMRITGLRSSVI